MTPLALPATLGLGTKFVTVFIDDSSPRLPSDDLRFVPNPDGSEVRQPPNLIKQPTWITIPVEAIGIALIVAALVLRRRAGERRRYLVSSGLRTNQQSEPSYSLSRLTAVLTSLAGGTRVLTALRYEELVDASACSAGAAESGSRWSPTPLGGPMRPSSISYVTSNRSIAR